MYFLVRRMLLPVEIVNVLPARENGQQRNHQQHRKERKGCPAPKNGMPFLAGNNFNKREMH
jgi:hypothetical protein